MESKHEDNTVIIAREDISNYHHAILLRFEKFDTVVLSAMGTHINKLERIVKLFNNINIKETKREYVPFSNTEALHVTLSKVKEYDTKAPPQP